MTSTQSTDATAAKRPSETEEETLKKKPKMEDEEEEEEVNMEEGEGEGEGEGEEEFDDAGAKAKAKPKGYLKYTPPPEEEPEWGKDSFDDLDEFVPNPESRDYFQNDDDYKEFCQGRIQALKDRGFLPDIANNIYPIGDLEGRWTTETTKREYLADLASLCVKKLNEEQEGSTVEFVSIVRGNISGGRRLKLYITFMAREHPHGVLVEYQAKAMDFAGAFRPPFPILCRPAPI